MEDKFNTQVILYLRNEEHKSYFIHTTYVDLTMIYQKLTHKINQKFYNLDFDTSNLSILKDGDKFDVDFIYLINFEQDLFIFDYTYSNNINHFIRCKINELPKLIDFINDVKYIQENYIYYSPLNL
jgi:NurA-like 5'-3' nuclease